MNKLLYVNIQVRLNYNTSIAYILHSFHLIYLSLPTDKDTVL